jgi:hypothetical protein
VLVNKYFGSSRKGEWRAQTMRVTWEKQGSFTRFWKKHQISFSTSNSCRILWYCVSWYISYTSQYNLVLDSFPTLSYLVLLLTPQCTWPLYTLTFFLFFDPVALTVFHFFDPVRTAITFFHLFDLTGLLLQFLIFLTPYILPLLFSFIRPDWLALTVFNFFDHVHTAITFFHLFDLTGYYDKLSYYGPVQ